MRVMRPRRRQMSTTLPFGDLARVAHHGDRSRPAAGTLALYKPSDPSIPEGWILSLRARRGIP
jgi:hypothetical protein